MATTSSKARRKRADKPPPNLKPEFHLSKEEEIARKPKKKKTKNVPDRPQPTWLHPPDEENTVLNPVIKSEEQKKKEKEEHDASINFLKRRAVGCTEIPAPPGVLLNLVGGFLSSYGFDGASRLFTAQLDARVRLEDWKVEYGKGLPSKQYPSLVKIFIDFHKQWEVDHADETSSSEDDSESSDSDVGKAVAGKSAKSKASKKKKKKKLKKKKGSDSDSSSESESDDGDDSMAAPKRPTATSSSSESDSESGEEVSKASKATELPNGGGKINGVIGAGAIKAGSSDTSSDSSSDSSTSDSSDSDSDSDAEPVSGTKEAAPIASTEIVATSASNIALPVSSDSSSSSDTSSSSDSEPESKRPVTKQSVTTDASKRQNSDSSMTLEASPEKNVQSDSSSSSSSDSDSDSSSDDDAGAGLPAIVPTTAVETVITKKRKLSDSPPVPEVKKQKKEQTRFHRVDPNTVVDPRFSNQYQSYDYADKAHQDLIVTKGKGFTKEKNKKKRGAYKGGQIDVGGGKGIRFED